MARSVIATLVGGAAIVAILGFGGVSPDNTQYLLAAFRRLDPAFLANDWFVQQTSSFHALFELWNAAFARHGLLELGLAAWFLLNALALGAALWLTLSVLAGGGARLSALAVTIAMLLAGNNMGWGEYQLLTAQALPTYLAYPSALAAVALLLARRLLACGLAVAVTGLIHGAMGALLIPLLALPLLACAPFGRRDVLSLLVAAAAVAAVIVPIVLLARDLDAGRAEDLRILFYARAPHHYAIQYAPAGLHLASLHLLASAVLAAALLPTGRVRARYLAFLFGLCGLFAAGYAFLEIWYQPEFVRLFPFRAFPLLVALLAAVVAGAACDRSLEPARRVYALVLASSSLLFPWSPSLGMLLLPAAPVLWLLTARARAARSGMLARASTPVVGLIALSAVALTVHASPPRLPVPWPGVDARALAEAFARYVPETAVVVVPPELVGVRLAARRAIVVNFKAFPVYASEMVKWADRMQAISGVDPRAAPAMVRAGVSPLRAIIHGFRGRSTDQLDAAAHRFGASFVLAPAGSRYQVEAQRQGRPALWARGGLRLFAVETAAAR